MRRALLACVLFLAGCVHWSGPHHPAAGRERIAIGAAIHAWVSAGRPPPTRTVCALDRAEIVLMTPEDSPCSPEANGCSLVVQPTFLGDFVPAIYVNAELGSAHRERVIVHEALHQLRGCVIVELAEAGDERWREARWWGVAERGERWPRFDDAQHADVELWGPIQRAAKLAITRVP